MKINRNYVSTNNTYSGNNPQYIVVHNTDNFKAGADALAHAKAQHAGNFSGMSAHYYVDDGDTAYQATAHNRGCWHVGKNFGGRLFGTVNNRNSIGVEMCVNAGYNYEKAFQNTVALVKQLMKETGIPASRVLMHYDVCAKNCPSAIRAKGDWDRFKNLISGSSSNNGGTGSNSGGTGNAVVTPGTYKVTVDSLNIRSGPGTNHSIVGAIKDKGTYTIMEIQNKTWGRLKSGAGWINCSSSYCKKVSSANESANYKIKVTADGLNVRSGPGTGYTKVDCITDKGTYTIVEEKVVDGTKWGKLKSGAGWICLKYTKRV